MDRYYWQDADPEVHPEAYENDWVGIVDQHEGGVIAWTFRETTADTIVSALNAKAARQ